MQKGSTVEDSLICHGCLIEEGATVIRSVLSPGVTIRSGCRIEDSIILTDTTIEENSVILRSILDKRIRIGKNCQIGANSDANLEIAMIGRNSIVPDGMIIHAGGTVGTDVVSSDYPGKEVKPGEYIQTRRLPNEI